MSELLRKTCEVYKEINEEDDDFFKNLASSYVPKESECVKEEPFMPLTRFIEICNEFGFKVETENNYLGKLHSCFCYLNVNTNVVGRIDVAIWHDFSNTIDIINLDYYSRKDSNNINDYDICAFEQYRDCTSKIKITNETNFIEQLSKVSKKIKEVLTNMRIDSIKKDF